MSKIVFFDTEVNTTLGKIVDFGVIDELGSKLHTGKINEFVNVIKKADYICGHNILNHDLEYLKREYSKFPNKQVIDTLYLSALLFPRNPYHKLVKDDKIISEQLNNPVNDSIKAKELFYDEINEYEKLTDEMKYIYKALLGNLKEFSGFFSYVDKKKNLLNFFAKDRVNVNELQIMMRNEYSELVCKNVNFDELIVDHPLELAYALSIIKYGNDASVTPRWVLMKYPYVEKIITILRNTPCAEKCSYCKRNLDPVEGLKKYFGYESFRSFDGKELQKKQQRQLLMANHY
jgi:ATP-dependent DNA helicase RecQ